MDSQLEWRRTEDRLYLAQRLGDVAMDDVERLLSGARVTRWVGFVALSLLTLVFVGHLCGVGSLVGAEARVACATLVVAVASAWGSALCLRRQSDVVLRVCYGVPLRLDSGMHDMDDAVEALQALNCFRDASLRKQFVQGLARCRREVGFSQVLLPQSLRDVARLAREALPAR